MSSIKLKPDSNIVDPIDLEALFLLKRVEFLLSNIGDSDNKLSVIEILTAYDDLIKLEELGFVVDSSEIELLLEKNRIFVPSINNKVVL